MMPGRPEWRHDSWIVAASVRWVSRLRRPRSRAFGIRDGSQSFAKFRMFKSQCKIDPPVAMVLSNAKPAGKLDAAVVLGDRNVGRWPVTPRMIVRCFVAAVALAGSVGFAQTPASPDAGPPASTANTVMPDGGRSPEPSGAVEAAIVGQRSFSLPVQVRQDQPAPAEVQLYVASVSDDDTPQPPALQWQMLGRQAFPAEAFDVTSPSDGRYFFAIRTLDSDGRVSPPGQLRPDVQVLVDTTGPVIELNAEATEDGQVRADVRIDDASAIQGVLIQYLIDGAPAWQKVDQTLGRGASQFQFPVSGDWRGMTLRVSAMDSLGHKTHVSDVIRRPRLAQRPGTRLADRGKATDALVASDVSSHSNPPVRSVGVPITRRIHAVPIGGSNAAVPENAGDSGALSGDSAALPPPATPEEITQSRLLNGPSLGALAPTMPESAKPASEDLASPGQSALRRWQAAGGVDRQWDPEQVMQKPRSVQDAMRPIGTAPVDRKNTSDRTYQSARVDSSPAPVQGDVSDDADASFVPFASTPVDAPVRYSDSPRFSLDYELEAVGSNGIKAVELWGSVDGGQSWEKWGEDPDLASPFDVETKGEGLFGFRIVVVASSGLSSPTPLAGESADINVVVDTTSPTTRIRGARYGDGDSTGCLIIQYDAGDEHLSARPVTLSFAPKAEGPWTTIAAGLRPDGPYVWPADPGLPHQLYLRVTATDLAGNVTSYALPDPIDTQGLAPRARIRGFRTLGGVTPINGREQTAGRLPRASFK
ncbi:hypothetical protein V7x_07640 [Crateriforma conspicua]|uniref:Ser-Thr-rich glycosyl-phosphatidyl-inositol-anchored membrane family protein n=2 Tax=Planctomycetaceae TaxID=126 RepID=A0A5C6FUW0_9PLAN|nr:hypothetical protein V7x_07640 [Crateriforma conspicua]